MTRLTFAARLVRALVADVLLAFADRIAEDRARQLRSRAEYRAFPIGGRFDDNRQTPCLRCEAPTYSRQAICRACQTKGER